MDHNLCLILIYLLIPVRLLHSAAGNGKNGDLAARDGHFCVALHTEQRETSLATTHRTDNMMPPHRGCRRKSPASAAAHWVYRVYIYRVLLLLAIHAMFCLGDPRQQPLPNKQMEEISGSKLKYKDDNHSQPKTTATSVGLQAIFFSIDAYVSHLDPARWNMRV